MPELYLVRHAQASFGADDYDKLSELGHQQSRWLGEHFRALNLQFDRIAIGSLRRHRETAEAMADVLGIDQALEILPGLNEYDFMAVLQGYLNGRELNDTEKSDRRAHFRLLRDALIAWSRDEISAPLPERWSEFEHRVGDALRQVCDASRGVRVLTISSGGAISMIMRHVLDISPDQLIRLNLQIKNTSYSRFVFSDSAIHLNGFNASPHLDPPERAHAVTYA